MTTAPPRDRIVLGSRGSELARIQARRVADGLRERWPGLSVDIEWITTTGDRVLDRPLPEIGGKGVFTAELEAALLQGEIHAAVHSLKDLPTDLGEAFTVLGVPEREDPRDVLLGPDGPTTVDRLAEGALVGTSSLRRRAQLLARRPDCRVRDVRGNVGTRIAKMEGGDYDAVILAAAGLRRLGVEGAADGPWLEPPDWLPAPGQGALAVEGRADDDATARLVTAVEDPDVRAAVEAERALLARLEGGCLVPVGALAHVDGEEVALEAVVLPPDGRREVRASGRAPAADAADLGRRVAEELIADGADRILAELEESG